MATTRAKFVCGSIIEQSYGTVVNLSAVYAPDDPESENGQFWTATPNGQIALTINNSAGVTVRAGFSMWALPMGSLHRTHARLLSPGGLASA